MSEEANVRLLTDSRLNLNCGINNTSLSSKAGLSLTSPLKKAEMDE